jgi:YVTN family beta-propeller protein
MASASSTASTATGIVFTANESSRSISQIDLSTGRVRTFSVPVMPHNVQTSPDGLLLLITGMMRGMAMPRYSAAHDMTDTSGELLIYDTMRLANGPLAEIAVGKHPAHVVVDPQQRYAFVTLSEESAVAVIDLAKRSIIARIPAGDFPHGARFSADGKTLYVADVKAGSVTAIDAASLRPLYAVAVGKQPIQVAPATDGTVYVSLAGDNAVAGIDPTTRSVKRRIPVGSKPAQIYFDSRRNELLVANQGTESAPGKTVSIIDLTTLHVQQVQVADGPHGIAEDSSRNYAFVTCAFADVMTVIDLRTNRVVSTFGVGAGPNGVTYSSAER